MHRRCFFILPTPFSFRLVGFVKYLIKGIPKQVMLCNKWLPLTKQIRLRRGSNLGYNNRYEMTSKDTYKIFDIRLRTMNFQFLENSQVLLLVHLMLTTDNFVNTLIKLKSKKMYCLVLVTVSFPRDKNDFKWTVLKKMYVCSRNNYNNIKQENS